MAGLVVGIGGGTGSGKSTIAAAVVERLRKDGVKATGVALDAFFIREGPLLATVPVVEVRGEAVPNRNCPETVDLDRAVAELERLQGEFEIVIIEGHLTLHYPELRERMGVKVFVDVPGEVRAVRRMVRDMGGGRGRTDPGWIGEYYLTCARPGHERWVEPTRQWADVIVSGEDLAGAISSLWKSLER